MLSSDSQSSERYIFGRSDEYYVTPQLGADAFQSLKAFIDSLKPIPLEDLEEDDRKCQLCSKRYGEPSGPGNNDSELPVRLHCNHVFGEKCLDKMFLDISVVELPLRPLSFGPGSRGHELLGILRAYAQDEKRYRDYFEVFRQMLESLCNADLAKNLFGWHWGTVLKEIFFYFTTVPLSKIQFMENALLIIMGTRYREDSPPTPISGPMSPSPSVLLGGDESKSVPTPKTLFESTSQENDWSGEDPKIAIFDDMELEDRASEGQLLAFRTSFTTAVWQIAAQYFCF